MVGRFHPPVGVLGRLVLVVVVLVPIDSLAAQALKLRHAVFQMRRCPCCLVEHAEKATVCRVVLSGWDELGLI